jgi:SAM-dependent methyltransferase
VSAPPPPSGRKPPERRRRALSSPGGPVTATGDTALAALVARALEISVDPDGDAALPLTHGFHSYPARFHPLLVDTLLDGVRPGAVLLDPFCGSGTALVEGFTHGLACRGTDLNPLAVLLARHKARVVAAPLRARFLERARTVADASLARVKARARTRTDGSQWDDPRFYAPHVFRELVGLREELAALPDDARGDDLRAPLLLCLTAIVVKVSRQRADTSTRAVERTIGKTLPTRLFLRKAEELAQRWADLERAVPPKTPPVDVRSADARRLGHVADRSVDVVVTSPPYLGTYDYAAHHARRFGWLELDARRLERDEIGARRRARDAADAVAAWQRDMDAVVGELARVLRPDGRIFVAIGDSAVGTRFIVGDDAVRRAAASAGLTVLAAAQQARPSFYDKVARPTRREHLMVLGRGATTSARSPQKTVLDRDSRRR